MDTRVLRYETYHGPGDESQVGLGAQFEFSSVPGEHFGEPDEVCVNARHRVTVTLEPDLLAAWQPLIPMTAPERDQWVLRVLFWYGREHLARRLAGGELPQELHLRLTPRSCGCDCPIDAQRVKFPPPEPLAIIIERPIGFRT